MPPTLRYHGSSILHEYVFRFGTNRLFFLYEKESLKGLTVLVVSLAGCSHTSRIKTNGVNTLIRVTFSERVFYVFVKISPARMHGLFHILRLRTFSIIGAMS